MFRYVGDDISAQIRRLLYSLVDKDRGGAKIYFFHPLCTGYLDVERDDTALQRFLFSTTCFGKRQGYAIEIRRFGKGPC